MRTLLQEKTRMNRKGYRQSHCSQGGCNDRAAGSAGSHPSENAGRRWSTATGATRIAASARAIRCQAKPVGYRGSYSWYYGNACSNRHGGHSGDCRARSRDDPTSTSPDLRLHSRFRWLPDRTSRHHWTRCLHGLGGHSRQPGVRQGQVDSGAER